MKISHGVQHARHYPGHFLVKGVSNLPATPERAEAFSAAALAAGLGVPSVLVQEGGYLTEVLGASLGGFEAARK